MLSPGDRLGRYEVVSSLGAGGMGEVYRARDTELEREVALKVLPEAVSANPERLRRFEREAKAVAALNHPNVLTVHDVGTDGGTAYLVTELLEGETLREHVSRRKVLPARAVEIGLEVARGLDAAHEKGIVHRDVKPANVFVSRDGRVKVLDFGLAKAEPTVSAGSEVKTETRPDEEDTSPGQLLGTVGYMSPEQVRGHALDGRSDVFSLGVVLYELLTRTHPFRRATEIATLTALLEEEPADVASVGSGVSPAVGGIVRRCLAKDRKERYASCRELIVALETALERPGRAVRRQAAEERSPYPGLSSFGEADADRFFGREAEVEALWSRLRDRKLLAVIGPSGAGKTSFVRAGVVASRPSGWAALVCTPGAKPLRNLGQALVPEVSSDADALRKLVGLEDTGTAFELLEQWRKGHGDALLVLDQFEELFTLNGPETQAELTQLLGRVAREADVHVLLSLRDDFLIRCSEHAALAPVFSELTPMPPLVGESLRRAVVEPAQREGYRFEDETLIEEMLGAVEGARGALPLLAFAVSRLWEKRDREKKVLTRAAYEEMGGVAGALAQHAEGVLERIGMVRQGLVREMFRNLVTAQGTRAVVEREELLSVFPEREAAEEVLETLIDARLLTSYEAVEPGSSRGAPAGTGDAGSTSPPAADRTVHRIEVVHESLLKAWPRLVMWQAQEEEGAILRDQLKQAARLWDEKGRPEELVWTGRAYLEYRAWRSRYEGGLSAVEEDFARAMADVAGRQRRRRRLALTAGLVVCVLVAAGASILWLRAERARRQADEQTLRREAAQLMSLGRLRLTERRSEALAFAIASLERADNEPSRRFALEALWDGPMERVFGTEEWGNLATFSPDGRWLATAGMKGAFLWPREGGSSRPLRTVGSSAPFWVWFSSDGRRAAVKDPTDDGIRVYSVEDGRETEVVTGRFQWYWLRRRLIAILADEGALPGENTLLRTWPLDGGAPLTLEPWDTRGLTLNEHIFDSEGDHLVEARDGAIVLRRLEALGRVERVLGRHEGAQSALFDPTGQVVVSFSAAEIRLWPLDRQDPDPARTLQPPDRGAFWAPPFPLLDPTGRLLAIRVRGPDQEGESWCLKCTWSVFDLAGPPDHEPQTIVRSEIHEFGFDPAGEWMVVPQNRSLSLWYLKGPRSWTIPFPPQAIGAGPVFSPDGRYLAAAGGQEVRLFPMAPEDGADAVRHAEAHKGLQAGLAYDPMGRFVVATHVHAGTLVVVPTSRGRVKRFTVPGTWGMFFPAISPDGARVVAGHWNPGVPGSARLGVWDLSTGERRDLDARVPGQDCGPGGTEEGMVYSSAFLSDGRLLTEGTTGLRLWDLDAGTSEPLRDCVTRYTGVVPQIAVTPDGRQVVTLTAPWQPVTGAPPSRLTVFDLEARTTREITSHGRQANVLALDPTGRILVTHGFDGVLRVGPLTGEEPHLIVEGPAEPSGVDVSPDGKWIASGTVAEGLRLWPMPDVTRPPLHTLPLEELLRRLRTHTNLRVVPDPGAESGYRVEAGSFPGWADPPEW